MDVKLEREAMRQFGLLDVENKQEGYVYVAEMIGGRQTGNAHVLRAKAQGYELVKGDDPENPGIRDERGNCVIVDTVLLRIKRERWEELEKRRQAITDHKRGNVSESSSNLAQQINNEVTKQLGKRADIAFSYSDPRDIQSRKG